MRIGMSKNRRSGRTSWSRDGEGEVCEGLDKEGLEWFVVNDMVVMV